MGNREANSGQPIPKSQKVFALVDCNNFYVSCERVFNPKIKDKPVAVLSNNDGVIVARSNEVKALGIPMGAPVFKYEKLLDSHNVTILSSNYQLYGDMSRRVMTSLQLLAPEVEIYSIDEAFLSLDGLKVRSYEQYCVEVKQKILQWTGIPVTIGIGTTKTLAKVANRIAKKNPEYRGVLDVTNNPLTDKFLEMTEVSDIWGVGGQYTRRLHALGIKNALQLRNLDPNWTRKIFTINGMRTVMELRGISCINLEDSPPPRKQIITSRSYGTPVEDLQKLRESVASYVAAAASKLRQQRSVTDTLTVYITTNYFKKHEPQYSNSCTLKLHKHTDYTPTLTKEASLALERIYRSGYRYKKAGVVLTGILPKERRQLGIFTSKVSCRGETSLMRAVDAINRNWGRHTIKVAAEGIRQEWKMRQDLRTGCFTTRWDELITIKI